MKHGKSFSDDQLKTKFDKIKTAVTDFQSQNIRRSLKRPGVDLEQTSTKKSKSTEAPKSDVPADSQQPSVEVPSQKAPIEDVEVPSNTASTTQHTGSSFKKVGIRKKQLGQKGTWEFTFESYIRYTTTHGWWPIPRLLIKVPRFRFVTVDKI
ncbi:hypothetical protein Tco_1331430 [Tanacetum coccineum]